MSHHQQPSIAYTNFSSSQGSSSMQSFPQPNLELYGLQTGMEMLGIMMPSKHQHGNIMPNSLWPQPNWLVDEDSSFDGYNRFYSNNYELKTSVYLIPAQELLNEFCNLKQVGVAAGCVKKQKSRVLKETDQSSDLFSMDSFQLRSHRAKLSSMLEEVDRRYKRYCEQMQAIVSAFEAVAGHGSATVYSTLASKAMSRHFRCLRDAIVRQIQVTKMAMGEKDPIVRVTTKGETPRLKLLDQRIRQQKMFRQGGMMENHPWRPQRGLPGRSVTILRGWLYEHFLHPYPSDVDKHILACQTGLSRSQISNWFINARVRLWKPMVEKLYMEEEKEQENTNQSSAAPTECENNQNPNPVPDQDQKPILPIHIGYTDSDSLTPIMITSNNINYEQDRSSWVENFSLMNFDFSSYNSDASISNQNFGNGVSLTLGLQQSIFFSRDQLGMCNCEQVQFSTSDGSKGLITNLPYRKLMGTQLLHD